MPESTYDRSYYVPQAVAAAEGAAPSINGEKPTEERVEAAESSASTGDSVPAKHSYKSELALFHGIVDRDHGFLGLLLSPLKMCSSPVVIFGILTYGLAITLLVVIATGSAQIFAAAYDFDAGAIGNTCEPCATSHPSVSCLTDHASRRRLPAPGRLHRGRVDRTAHRLHRRRHVAPQPRHLRA